LKTPLYSPREPGGRANGITEYSTAKHEKFIRKLARTVPIEYEILKVENGQKHELMLSDGTKVILDSGSELKYPTEFERKSTKVSLKGEAYFEIVHDSKKDFVVEAHHARMKTNGANFNVRAWRDNQQVQVTVLEGKVSFNSKDGKEKNKRIVEANQYSSIYANGIPDFPSKTNVNRNLAWIRDEIILTDIPISEVISQMERWYDIEITIPESIDKKELVSIHLKRNDLDNMLEVFSNLTHLLYEKDSSTIIFYY